MSEWKITTLGQEVDLLTGNPFKSVQYTDNEGDVLLLRGDNIGQGLLRWENAKRWSTEKTEEIEDYFLQEDDVVLAMDRPWIEAGLKFAYLSQDDLPCLLVQRVSRLRAKPKLNQTFLRYVIQGYEFTQYIIKTQTGTAVPHISGTQIKDFEFLIPPLSEQEEIAKTLGGLDRKISNLREQNETLERIAQTLFKHWFVDFEFPNEDGKPYKSSGGEMVRSESGEIPVGWNIGKLGDFCNIKHGYAFSGEFITTEETNQILLTPGNFRIGGGFNSLKYKYYSDYDYDEEYILAPGDLIVTMTDLSKEGDTLGYPALVPKYSKNVFLHNQRLGKVVNSRIDLFFLFFLLCRREYRSHILGTASGSTVRHTSPSRILEYKFAVPARDLLDRFSLTASNLICKSFSNHAQIETLTKTRDVLLPKLMSGKLRITAS